MEDKYTGGAIDACMMWKKSELQPILEECGLKKDNFNDCSGGPFELLPKWMTSNTLGDK